MHKEVLDWVEESVEWWGAPTPATLRVLEFGSLDINGSVRSVLAPLADSYTGIDANYGKGVDIVADASVFRGLGLFDLVVCCEVFEHTAKWAKIVTNAHSNLTPGGLFICTMAGEGRPTHSALDENPKRDWEYYRNVSGPELEREMGIFKNYEVGVLGQDTRGRGIK
jgi:SAM-dependent methyltransferase